MNRRHLLYLAIVDVLCIPRGSAVTYGPTWFAGHDAFFAGASSIGAGNDALIRSFLQKQNGQWVRSKEALASDAAFKNKEFVALTATPNTDAVTKTGLLRCALSGDKKVYARLALTLGAVTPSNPLNDASGSNEAAKIQALAASNLQTFAAVVGNGGTGFGKDTNNNSGIARLNATILLNAATGNAGNKAYKVSVQAGGDNDTTGIVSIARTGNAKTETESSATLWWDDHMQRLFVGISEVSAIVNTGAICPVLVGSINPVVTPATNQTMTLRTIVNTGAASDDWSGTFSNAMPTHIIGFKDNTSATTSIYKLRTMHTSTGKTYLILNGGTADNANDKATLPLEVQAVAINNDGFVTSVPIKNVATTVGANLNLLYHGSMADEYAITDMQVVGDTVYISLAGTRDATDTQEAGIFFSTALFAIDGTIRAWTPWAPLGGQREKTAGFGFDRTTNNLYLAPAENITPPLPITTWTLGNSSLHTTPLNNSDAIKALANSGGVLRLIPFDEATPNFVQKALTTDYPAFSMMVATGLGQAALIETGGLDTDDVYQPTATFDANTTRLIASPALATLGPIYTAEFSRATVAAKTWLFLGGLGGLAVLRNGSSGAGFNQLSSVGELASANVIQLFAPDAKGNKTNPFAYLRALRADGAWLYVLTNSSLHRIKLEAPSFRTAQPMPTANVQPIIAAPQALTGHTAHDQLLHLVQLTATQFLLGTTRGLYTITINATTGALVGNPNTDMALGPVLAINALWAQQGMPTQADGNLYVTAFDTAQANLNVYRFNVANGSINKITEPSGTDYFYTIGSTTKVAKNRNIPFGFDQFCASPQYGSTQLFFVDGVAQVPDPAKFLQPPIGPINAISLETDLTDFALASTPPGFGSMVLDPASGTRYIPGQLGVRANE